MKRPLCLKHIGTNNRYSRIWATTCLLLISSCSFNKPERLPGEGVFVAFERHGRFLDVYGGQGIKLHEMADLEQLKDTFYIPRIEAPSFSFMPGNPPEMTSRMIGKPDSVRTDTGARYFVYRRPQGIFEVGEEESGKNDVSYPLYYRPNNRRAASFLDPAIVGKLRPDVAEETVEIFECGIAQPTLIVVLKRGQLDEIILRDIREVRGRVGTYQCTPWS